PKDCISLVGITGYGKHGVYDFEREEGQTFTADVDLYTDTRTAASTDNLENTIDYSVLAEDIRSILAGPPSNLIEQVAE
ncbi:dihydroneopterin aldolase, partial [Streptococcus agalactiae]